jgi:predicted Zn-dependent peptidase
MKSQNPEYFQFKNGIRLVHQQTDGPVAHLGVFIQAGSRDELSHEHGMAHFIEHSIFKGTEKRKAYHILSRMEDVGAEINAYTAKEETCIYSSFLFKYYSRAAELLYDICFHSVFPEKEIAKEKTVIIDEINSYKDSPSEEIFDRFEDQLFPGHALGHDILGSPAHLSKFDREMMSNFISRTWNTDQIVISSVGNIRLKSLIKYLSPSFGEVQQNIRSFSRNTPVEVPANHIVKKKKVHQSHLVMGSRAYHVHDDKRTGLILLNNLLGGPGMSSRLNLNIRERYGWTYHIESSYAMFSDAGIWSVYLGTEPAWIDKCRDLVLKELKKLKQDALGTLQLHKAKNQLLGTLAMSQENNGAVMLGNAKTFSIFGKIDSFSEIEEKVLSISAAELQEIANEIFNETSMHSLLFSGK